MARKITIDKNKCIGCGVCVAIADKTFRIGTDGKSELVDNPSDNEEIIQQAIDSCPVGAISWSKEKD